MQSIFRYPGGKTKGPIQDWITTYMPKEVKEYREPFVGGGGVFFGIKDWENLKRWINDKNEGLIAVYEALRDREEEFIAQCKSVPPPQPNDPLTSKGTRDGKPVNKRLKDIFDEVALNDSYPDQAFRYFFVNRTVFGGRVNYDIPSRLFFSNPEGWNIVATDRLERAAGRLKGTTITCGEYEPLFTEPGEGVWIYADPPYQRDTELTASSKLYQHSFTWEDHKRFADVVRKCKHHVAISYDDTPEVRELYSDAKFRIVKTEWAYCGTTNEKKDVGQELLILNYEPPMPGFFASWSKVDEEELARCEEVISRGLGSFVETGEALRTIRRRRLYLRDYRTFEEYCRKRWEMSDRNALRLMTASNIARQLKTRPIGRVFPETESQVREIVRLAGPDGEIDMEKVAQVWTQAVEKAGGKTPTAAMVREQVQAALGPQLKTSTVDDTRSLRQVKNLLPKLSPEHWIEVKLLIEQLLANNRREAV